MFQFLFINNLRLYDFSIFSRELIDQKNLKEINKYLNRMIEIDDTKLHKIIHVQYNIVI